MLSTSTLITRIRLEYENLPGLKLSMEQARRLWDADDKTCGAALEALIAEGFLHRTGTGKFIALPRPSGQSAKAADTSTLNTAVRCPHCQKLNTMEQRAGKVGRTGTAFRCIACRELVSFTAISA